MIDLILLFFMENASNTEDICDSLRIIDKRNEQPILVQKGINSARTIPCISIFLMIIVADFHSSVMMQEIIWNASKARISEAEGLHKGLCLHRGLQQKSTSFNKKKCHMLQVLPKRPLCPERIAGQREEMTTEDIPVKIQGIGKKERSSQSLDHSIEEGAAKIYNLITRADTKEASTAGDAGEFALIGVTSEICDKKNRVLFTDTDCLVLSKDFMLPDESMVALRVLRKHNLFTINLNNLSPQGNLACLVAKASVDESVKWHRRMGHENYKNMNKLVKGACKTESSPSGDNNRISLGDVSVSYWWLTSFLLFGADLNNLASTVEVSPVATKPNKYNSSQSLILGGIILSSCVQNESKVNKTTTGHLLLSVIFQTSRENNHTDFQHCPVCLFSSQVEPRSVAQPLTIQAGLCYAVRNATDLSSKVMFLVDLPVVARIEAIRLFLAFASYMGFMVYQMDVKSAFLYGRIDEEAYVPLNLRICRSSTSLRGLQGTIVQDSFLKKAPKEIHLGTSLRGLTSSLDLQERPSVVISFLMKRKSSYWLSSRCSICVTRVPNSMSILSYWLTTFLLRSPELGPPTILATIDETPYTITEDSVRSQLQLADDGGIDDYPIRKSIFKMCIILQWITFGYNKTLWEALSMLSPLMIHSSSPADTHFRNDADDLMYTNCCSSLVSTLSAEGKFVGEPEHKTPISYLRLLGKCQESQWKEMFQLGVAPRLGVSNKGKTPMVEEDIIVKERTLKQMEDDRLGEEAAKRLHDEEQAQVDRQIARLNRRRQQDIFIASSMYYTGLLDHHHGSG
ncbi:putative ribonuclease H-like domain-containing protein [Tanacetum coccineum]